MTAVRKEPCSSCPYRQDVPSGVWAAEEYDKLPPYDNETFDQPFETFGCHATPEFYCHGWAVVHTSRGHAFDLVSLRLHPPEGGIPEAFVPLFDSGQDAADHGKLDIGDPSWDAVKTIRRLKRKYPRLRETAGA